MINLIDLDWECRKKRNIDEEAKEYVESEGRVLLSVVAEEFYGCDHDMARISLLPFIEAGIIYMEKKDGKTYLGVPPELD